MMKILYLYIGGSTKHSSIQNKIISKIATLNKINCKTTGVFFSTNVKNNTKLNENINIIKVKKASRYLFPRFQQLNFIYSAINKYLSENINQFDITYFRYPLANKYLYRLVKKYPNKICFEHNSKEVEEIKISQYNFKLTLKPSHFLPYIQDYYLLLRNEITYASKVFKHSLFGICVTNEIAEYEKNRSTNHLYKTFTISNGINTNNINIKTSIQYNKNLNLIFFRGAATKAQWYGIDRLFCGLSNYKGNISIHLFIVGNVFDGDKKFVNELNISKYVTFTGALYGDKLNSIVNNCHIGIASLGLHRINLIEGATLKAKEYIARGLPIILAYKDIDISDNSLFSPYILQIKSDETPIAIQAIINFAEKIYKKPNIEQKIRQLAEKHLDTKIKMKSLVKILNNQNQTL